jgi:hypothetical protein
MEKEKYLKPNLEIATYKDSDVIVTSAVIEDDETAWV